ncbi:hypothetical protein [Rhizobium leguminosarum]|uniref:hypothetical protein n=1 Tax=Rhizobium leguminosarum TaxID=384 RepID=UPI00143F8484|nr:hypothetical protein [Rhizobium leguminosarum]NKL18474.1 hypothetical protein [Rhizobium leguminosarum bv. viciae]
MIIDFDSNDWIPHLDAALGDLVEPSVKEAIRGGTFEYIDDARRFLLSSSDPVAIIERTLDWIKSCEVMAYHGTYLNDERLAALEMEGLRQLVIANRIAEIRARHPEIAKALSFERAAEIVQADMLGGRDGQLHATISLKMFDEYDYATDGSEFDRRLLEGAGLGHLIDILKDGGRSRIIHLKISGAMALDAMHPHVDIESLLAKGDLPNFVKEVLDVYAYHLHDPSYERRGEDSCLMFYHPIPATAIQRIVTMGHGLRPRLAAAGLQPRPS